MECWNNGIEGIDGIEGKNNQRPVTSNQFLKTQIAKNQLTNQLKIRN